MAGVNLVTTGQSDRPELGESTSMTPFTLTARTAAEAALLGLAAIVGLTACGEPKGTITALPTSTTVPATTASSSKAVSSQALNGTRKVVIVPVPSFESILALNDQGRLNLTDGESADSLFVFTPVKSGYLIRTATDGDRCLQVTTNAARTLTVVAERCDPSENDQVFTVSKDGSAYAISNQSAFLQVSSGGELIAEELGGPQPSTTFTLADNGRSTLPALS